MCKCDNCKKYNRCNCEIKPTSGCTEPKCSCEGIQIPPIFIYGCSPFSPEETEVCCDSDCCCKVYPKRCRNKFWPSFAKPRWLCCDDLYCVR